MDYTANLFKTYFESVYSHQSSNVHHIQYYNTDISFSSCEFTVTDIFETLRNLSFNSKSGPDIIPEIIYKNVYFSLTRPIHYLFNLFLLFGCFPDQ